MAFRCLRCKAELDSAYRACPHCGEVITEFTRQYTGNLLDGKYEVVERLGAGGMGQVFKATHKYLGATRVIKVVHPQISENKDAQDRFLREARAATKVTHPNVATMYDFAELPDGSHYMVSEFIDGENLAQRLRTRGTLPPKQAVRIIIQTLNGLEAIHRAGIVHRDVSPENLMITRDETVKIIDLGVAKVDDVSEVAATRTGIFVGKLRYASPEQLGLLNEDEKIDGRADVYATAMVLFELLMGRPPYEAKSPHEYFLIHTREQDVAIGALPAELPGSAALQDVLRRALARDRNQRFASAKAFAAALEEIDRALPDPREMATVSTPLDGDETMRLKSQTAIDTLHRETVRTDAPSPLPPPVAPPPVAPPHAAAAPTILTPLPAPIAPPKMEQGVKPGVVIAVVAILALLGIGVIAGGVMYFPKLREKFLKPAAVAETTTRPAAPATDPGTVAPVPQPISEASVNVVTTTSEPPPTTTTAIEEVTTTTQAPITLSTTTTNTPPPRPVPRTVTPPPVPKPRVEPRPEPPRNDDPPPVQSGFVEPYVDGGGDEDSNERALQSLKAQLRGVKRVEVHGGALEEPLKGALQEDIPFLQIVDRAPVVIRFSGRLDGVGRGRKVREASATIIKNGRVIFRYELPNEVYRVGLPPTHAFSRVLSDAFEE